MQKKKIYKIVSFILLLVMIFQTNIFADVPINSNSSPDTIFDYNNMPNPTTNITKINSSVDKIWGSIRLILQVASVTAVIFAGVRYMFASADQKADLKKSMIYLVIGAILVFGATFVIEFVVKAFKDISGAGTP